MIAVPLLGVAVTVFELATESLTKVIDIEVPVLVTVTLVGATGGTARIPEMEFKVDF